MLCTCFLVDSDSTFMLLYLFIYLTFFIIKCFHYYPDAFLFLYGLLPEPLYPYFHPEDLVYNFTWSLIWIQPLPSSHLIPDQNLWQIP